MRSTWIGHAALLCGLVACGRGVMLEEDLPREAMNGGITHPAPDAAVGPDANDVGLDDVDASGEAPGLPSDPTCDDPGPPPIDPELLTVCPECPGGARCVPSALVEASAPPESMERLGACDGAAVCVPDPIIRSNGLYQPHDCDSIDGAEGRCLSVCLPEVHDQADTLPQAGCDAYERCVPCFDPRDGQSTGACEQTCDEGPQREAHMFPRCCGGAGMCVPSNMLPEGQRAQLGRDDCAREDALCAPTELADGTTRPATCDAIAGAEGRCLPACLPAVRNQAEYLSQGECQEGALCAPCADPRTGEETGACRINGDAPMRDPLVFDTACCGSSGRCIPGELAGENASLLPADRCLTEQGEGWLCAPRQLVEDPSHGSPFAACRVRVAFFNVGSGRCVPRCIAEQQSWAAGALPRSSCESGELCVPCTMASGLAGC